MADSHHVPEREPVSVHSRVEYPGVRRDKLVGLGSIVRRRVLISSNSAIDVMAANYSDQVLLGDRFHICTRGLAFEFRPLLCRALQ